MVFCIFLFVAVYACVAIYVVCFILVWKNGNTEYRSLNNKSNQSNQSNQCFFHSGMHALQFLHLATWEYFIQQDLEKVNSITIPSFINVRTCASNHHDFKSLKQILKKHNQ